MALFNNSLFDAYIYGNIIKPYDIYVVNNFDILCNMIKNKIKNPNIIRILNNIFTPINKEDGSMDIDLSVKTYENIMITDIVDTKNSIIYNDEIILYDWFVNNLINKKITNYNLIIIESTIKYTWGTISNETFSKTDI